MSAEDRLTVLKWCQRLPSQTIVGGSNIDVDNTNLRMPVVSVFIDEQLDMHGQNLTDSTGTLHLTATNVSLPGTLLDNAVSGGTAGQFLSAGAGGHVVWSTIPGGSGIAAVNAGTNISIPDPGIPVVSVDIQEDLEMNGNNITSTGDLDVTVTGGMNISAEAPMTISTTSGGADMSLTTGGGSKITLNASGDASLISNNANTYVTSDNGIVNISAPHASDGTVNISAYSAVTISTVNDQVSILSGDSFVDIAANAGDLTLSTYGNGNIATLQAPIGDVVVTAGNAVTVNATNSCTFQSGGDMNYYLKGGSVTLETLINTAGPSIEMNASAPFTISSGTDLALSAPTGTVTVSTSGTCSVGCQGLTLNGGDEYVNMGAEVVGITSVANTDITAGQFVNITATANDINLTASSGSIVTSSANVSMQTSSGGIEIRANGSNLVLASTGDAVNISSGGGDQVSITGGGGGINCYTTSNGNIGLTSDGNILLTSDNLNMDSTTLSIPNSSAATNATLTASLLTMSDSTRITQVGANALNMLANSFLKININGDNGAITTTRTDNGDNLALYNSATGVATTDGVPTISHYKNGRNANAGDIIGQNLYYAKDYTGSDIQFARIQASVRNNALGNTDGSVALSGLINGVMTEFFRVNGADSENNCFLPLDMNGQSVKSSTGNLAFSSTGSSGGGVITMTSKTQAVPSTADFIIANGATNNLTHSVSDGWDLQDNNIIGVNNILYNTTFSNVSLTLSPANSAVVTFNGAGLTATLPNVDATNVGRQFIITNTNAGNLTVTTVGGTQLIYSSTGAASATSRTLATGHSQIFTAILTTSASTFGWSMV